MMVHKLKTWSEPFALVCSGDKTFEFRVFDRPYRVGDQLHLREWCPEAQAYTGDTVDVLVTHMIVGGKPDSFGVPDGYVCMSIARVHE